MGKPMARTDLPSRADRKFAKKLQFYSEVRDTVAASLSATTSITKAKKKKLRPRQKKLKVYDLSVLSGSLPELKAPKKPPPPPKFKLNCKSRTELVVSEAERLKQYRGNPDYQKDPLAYIYQHLLKTRPVPEEKSRKNTNKNGGKKRKNKAKASGSPVPMEL